VILIVGAGIGGMALASLLAPRSRVCVVDRRERPGLEASAQNAGLVRRLAEDPIDRALAVRTAAWLADPGGDWDAPPSRAVGAVVGLVRDPTVLDDAAAHLCGRGVAVEALADVREIAPALAGAPLSAAWFLPDERVARSDVLVDGWRRRVERAGGTVRCGVHVHRLAITAGRVTGVVTRDGTTIGADQVVLAAGAWTGALAARAGLHRPLIPVRRTLVHTAPHVLARPDHVWWWLDDVGIYGRADAGSWLVSGCDEHVDFPAEETDSTLPATAAELGRVREKLAWWTPALATAELTSGASGLRTFTPDRRPMLGADPEAEGLWWLAGLGGAGVSGGFAAAEAVAAWMDGRASAVLRHPALVAPARPQPQRWVLRPDGDAATSELVSG
jgi:D-arginine dehydrogenase